LRRILNWVIWTPVTVLVLGFAVANRQWIDVSFDPFDATAPAVSIGMPLWALLFCGLFLGALAGWTVCWVGQGKWRRSARNSTSELRRAQDEIASLKRQAASSGPLPPTTIDPVS
jgi:hypothetical protein